jgi:methionyl-tRNA formyltransferase
LLDWNRPAAELERRVRAFNPWPVAETCTAAGERLRIWRAEARADRVAIAPGRVLAAGAEGIDVATAEGILRLKSVQAPGGREMAAAAWIAAHPIEGMSFVAPG